MSSIFRLSWQDLVKGLVVAVLSSVLATAEALISNKGFDLSAQDLSAIGAVAATSAMAYLLKQLFTDEQGKLGGKI